MSTLRLAIVTALGALLLQAAPIDPKGAEFFEARIRPILAERCYPCHSARAPRLQGGLRLDTPGGLLQGGNSGPAIVASEPGQSLLIRAVHYTDDHLKMPPGKPLSAAEVADLEAWVTMGAPDPRA